MKKIYFAIVVFVLFCLFSSCKTGEPDILSHIPAESLMPEATADLSRGFSRPIPESIREVMRGVSMPEGASVSFDELSYLTIPYYDFNGEIKEGHMVAAAELADEILDIFSELFLIQYPIENMELIDFFNDRQTAALDSLDRASMGNNNTSCFCYRVVSGQSNLSQHAYGRAIDLNPLINPYVTSEEVSPRNAGRFADRSGAGLSRTEQRALIRSGEAVYSIFVSRGWEWGGEIWKGIYDYQHFQKPK